jgi:predicted PurR-regulated permease PerM
MSEQVGTGAPLGRAPGDGERLPLAERIVRFPARTIVGVLVILLAVGIVLYVLWVARHVISWMLISLFLALALNPAVEAVQRRSGRGRATSAGIVYLLALLIVAGLAALFVPPLVSQVNDFVDKVPSYVDDVTKGRGRLGFLETRYHIVERIQDQIKQGGTASKLAGFSGTAVSITKSVITAVAGAVTIVFMTFFMLLEGPAWVERFFGVLPEESRPRWRAVAHDIYRTVGGYVTGNLLISVIAGVSSAIVLAILGVPYALALGLIVAILDLIPLAGATLAAIIISGVAFLHTIVAGVVVVVFFIVYQQVENHLLQPLVYGRTVKLSPLAVLIAVLIGAELAGILGALGAIPVAGALQVIVVDWQRHRRERASAPAAATSGD